MPHLGISCIPCMQNICKWSRNRVLKNMSTTAFGCIAHKWKSHNGFKLLGWWPQNRKRDPFVCSLKPITAIIQTPRTDSISDYSPQKTVERLLTSNPTTENQIPADDPSTEKWGIGSRSSITPAAESWTEPRRHPGLGSGSRLSGVISGLAVITSSTSRFVCGGNQRQFGQRGRHY